MIFIVGVKIPDNLLVLNGICKIYGIGYGNGEKICKNFGFLRKMRVKDINQKDWSNILQFILKNNIKIEKDLKKKLRFDIWHLLDIRNYRGIRHTIGLSVRGQRTHSNAKTQKKLHLLRIGKRNFSFSNIVTNKFLKSSLSHEITYFKLYLDTFKNINYNIQNFEINPEIINYPDSITNETDEKLKEEKKNLFYSNFILDFKLNNFNLIKTSNDFFDLLIFSSNYSKNNSLKLFSKILKKIHLKIFYFKNGKSIRKFKKLIKSKKYLNKLNYNLFFIEYENTDYSIYPSFINNNVYKFNQKKNILFPFNFINTNKCVISNEKISGSLTIYSKYSNIFIYFTDIYGNLIKYVSGGSIGLKGKQKGSPFAGRTAMDSMIKFLREKKLKNFKIIKKGIGPAKKQAFRRLFRFKKKFKCSLLIESTIIPHNGCRLKKIRR